jgi:hypothetical protein
MGTRLFPGAISSSDDDNGEQNPPSSHSKPSHIFPASLADIEMVRAEPNPSKALKPIRHTQSREIPSYERVCQQLRGHVEFLMHLVATPELLSLFLISEHDSTTMIPSTTQPLMLEQVSRTTKFLADLPDSECAEIIPTIEAQLNFQFNPSRREEDLRRFIKQEVTDPHELSELLFQEIMICDAEQRFLVNLSKRRIEIKRKLKRKIEAKV